MLFKQVKWQELLRNAAASRTIKASELRRIPHLKTCPYWDQAEFLGRVEYKHRFATYDGGLVKYDDRLYYVNSAQIKALSRWVRWNLNKTITVSNE